MFSYHPFSVCSSVLENQYHFAAFISHMVPVILKKKKKIYIISRLCPLQPIGVTVIGSIAKLSEFQFQLHYFLTM